MSLKKNAVMCSRAAIEQGVCCCCRPVCLWLLLLLLPGTERHVRVHADVLLLWVYVHGLLCLLPHAGRCRLQIIPHFCTTYLQVSKFDSGCAAVSSAIHVSLMCHSCVTSSIRRVLACKAYVLAVHDVRIILTGARRSKPFLIWYVMCTMAF